MSTYTSAASGLWSAGTTWVGGVKPPSSAGHKIVIAAGHVVTYDEADGIYGDDTSTAVTVNGGIKFSRSVSTKLTLRGQLVKGTAGGESWDRGTVSDPIPAGVTSIVLVNDSATPANGKWSVTWDQSGASTWSEHGADKTAATDTVGALSAGSTSIVVADASGWEVGDRIGLDGDVPAAYQTNPPHQRESRFVSGPITGSGPFTVPIALALSYSHETSTKVVNLTRNVRWGCANSAYYSADLSIAPRTSFTMRNVEIATGFGGLFGVRVMTTNLPSPIDRMGTLFRGLSVHDYDLSASPGASQTPRANGVGLSFDYAHMSSAEDCVGYVGSSASVSAYSLQDSGVSSGTLRRFVVIGGGNRGINFAGPIPATRFEDCHLSAFSGIGGSPPSTGITISNCKLKGRSGFSANGTAELLGCTFECSQLSYPANFGGLVLLGGWSDITARDSTLIGYAATPGDLFGSGAQQLAGGRFRMIGINGDRTVGWLALAGAIGENQADVIKSSPKSLRLRPGASSSAGSTGVLANLPCSYKFTLSVKGGQSYTFRPNLRADSSGGATPPSVSYSGPGVSVTDTLSAPADTWQVLPRTITPSSSGTLTISWNVKGGSGAVYFDGMPDGDYVLYSRHFGYYLDNETPYVIADPRITLSESAALALPVSVNHATSTITVTGALTPSQVFQACIADLCQTANLGEAVHISSATGDTFETTYTVVGTVAGVYTDAVGTSAVLTLTGLQDASVLLVDGTGATVEFQAAQSGQFDYVYNFAPGATGAWKWVAKAPGREHATGTFTPGAGGALTYAPVLVPKLTPSGDPMYTGTTSALVAVSISGTTNAYIDIGDGTAPLQETFNETELALVTQAGMEWLAAGKDDVSVFDSGSGDYLFLTAGWRLRRASAGDANAAIEAYVTGADGAIVDDTNGPVLYLTSNTPAAIAAAVWAYIDRELTQAIPTAAQIADTVLGRNLAGGSDGGRTVRDALRASRNKSAISGSTLTIYQEDDATPAWTAAVSTAERDALQSIDPA